MPEKELIRLLAVNRFLNLNISKDDELQDILELADCFYDVSFSIITLVNYETLYISKNNPVKISRIIQDEPLYHHLINRRKTLIIDDANSKKYSKYKQITIKKKKLRFYVSVPLITHDNHHVGNFLMMDYQPKQLNKKQKSILQTMAKRIVQLIEFEFSLDILKDQFMQAKGAEIKLRSFFESSGACHLLIGKQLEILAFNKNMADFIGKMHNVTLYPGITVDKILREKYLEDFISDYHKALNGTPVKYERRVDYSGIIIWWYVTFEPGYNLEGEIIGISYNATDITERKQYEQKILDQNSSLRTIAHVQSHDLRKPVASILGFMEMFKSENYKSTPEELMMMEKAVTELDTRIREIVNMSSQEE